MNYSLNPCCPFWNIFSPASHFSWLSPPLLNLPLHLLLSIYLSLCLPISRCLLHLLPVLLHPTLAVRVTESYPSCHHKGNVRERQGETGGGNRMMLLAVHGSALACCDTCKHSVLHPRSIFVMAGCQWRHSTWAPVYPNIRHSSPQWRITKVHSNPLHTVSHWIYRKKIITAKTQKVKYRVLTGAEQILVFHLWTSS